MHIRYSKFKIIIGILLEEILHTEKGVLLIGWKDHVITVYNSLLLFFLN